MSTEDSKLNRLLKSYVALVYARPWTVVGVLTVVLAGAVFLSSQLGFIGDMMELLPKESDEVKDLHLVEARAGGAGYFITQVTGGTEAERRTVAKAYADSMEKKTELVRYVEYRFDMRFFRTRALWLLGTKQLEELHTDLQSRITYEKKKANPFFVDISEEEPPADFDAVARKYTAAAPQSEYIESKDGAEQYLYVKPTGQAGDLDYDRKLIAAARASADEVLAGNTTQKIDFTGPFVIRVEEDEMMQRDLKTAAIIASIVALGVILLATRKISALFVSFAPVTLGVAITFAFARITIGHLNPVTGFLGAILVGLGIEYGIHLSMRFWEEREKLDVRESLDAAVVGTFTGAVTSAATNAVAFLVLIFARFDAFKQFGRIAGFGVMATVISAYLLAPAILVIAERIRPFRRHTKASGLREERNWPRLPTWSLATVLIIVGVAAAYSFTVAHTVGFETDLRRLKGESPATALDDHITKQLGIIMAPALLSVSSLDDARVVSKVVDDVRKEKGDLSSFQQVASLNDMVPSDIEGHRAGIAELKKLMEDVPNAMKSGKTGEKVEDFQKLLDSEPWTINEVPSEIRRRFSALDEKGTFVLLFPRYSGYDVNEFELWHDDLGEVIAKSKERGVELHILDGNRLAATVFRLIRDDGPFVLGSAALVVFLMIWLSLRSLLQAVLVAAPLFLGMICVLGGMHLLDVRLNFLNVVVLPNLLTIAVDNSVHLYHRYKEEGPGSMGHVWRTTGFAAIVATISNAAGYGALLVAHHEGLRSVAVLALLGVGCTFMGTTLFFPAMMELIERLRGRKTVA